MNRRGRLQKLEKVAALTRTVDDTRQRRYEEDRAAFEEAWAIMSASMREEHARLVVDAYAAGAHEVLSPDYHSPAAGLLRRCLGALQRRNDYWPYTEIDPEVRLAMPAHVAQVYLEHPDVLPFHDCEDCGYKVPHEYFSECPLCGGKVGWYAFWKKRKLVAETGRGR